VSFRAADGGRSGTQKAMMASALGANATFSLLRMS